MREWKDINKELPKRDLDELDDGCLLKFDDGDISEANYHKDTEEFSQYFGNYYHIKKENNWRLYRICEQRFLKQVATHWSINKPTKDKNK